MTAESRTVHYSTEEQGGLLRQLERVREGAGRRVTEGLREELIRKFLATDHRLAEAIEEAVAAVVEIDRLHPGLRAMDEPALIAELQAGFVHFYGAEAINPYVPVAGRGPWVISAHGAVIHDSGGYGMLGFGHNPPMVRAALARPQVMANIMTASFAQHRLVERLQRELGHSRGGSPFSQVVCMNSGSEAMTVAARIADIHAWRMTRPGGVHEGRKVRSLAIRGAFHGRTDRPAQLSDSTRPKYQAHLASFQGLDNLITVEANNVDSLEAAFAAADAAGVHIEAMYMEPVMGEGNPGVAVERAFYEAARRLTRQHGGLLVVDSIQAGLRAQGVLSIVDYPGFEGIEAPDMESWSKAINGGQYPLSVLGLTQRAAEIYVRGLYGNTMTTNPRAMDVAVAVLDAVTPELRENIRRQGAAFKAALQGLMAEFPEIITGVSGTGLLFACDLDPERWPVMSERGIQGVEERCRHRGLGVIHGGKNALRFTPPFDVRDEEVELLIGELREVFRDLRASVG
jgi:acetylornithine/succinyldiaminopimelate/putrescine aminotransferase